MASVAIAGLFGCSSESENSTSPLATTVNTQLPGEVLSDEVLSDEVLSDEILSVNKLEAKAHLAKFRRSVVDSRRFKASTSEESENATIEIDSSLQNGNFAVDADVITSRSGKPYIIYNGSITDLMG